MNEVVNLTVNVEVENDLDKFITISKTQSVGDIHTTVSVSIHGYTQQQTASLLSIVLKEIECE